MSVGVALGVSIAGGLGAALRYLIGQAVAWRSRTQSHWATTLVNVTGSFALGVVVGASSRYFSSDVTLMLGTGLLGGYTTLSTASLETVELFSAGQRRSAALYSVGTLLGSVVAALIGLSVFSD